MNNFIKCLVSLIVVAFLGAFIDSRVQGSDWRTPALFSLKGVTITNEESLLIEKLNPVGIILFARNCMDEAQTVS